jgi:23S rRNA (guanosine2251-2'-O)-methyltransferase
MKEWISGRNPVLETLKAGRRTFFQLKLARGLEEQGRVDEIKALAFKKKIPLGVVDRTELNHLAENHQGVALQVGDYPYTDVAEMLDLAQTRDEPPFILILDVLQDPQNFGTLIRSAAAFGVYGIIIPFHRAVGITPAVVHASSGASEHLLIAQSNLAQAIEALKQNNVWVVGLESSAEAQDIATMDLRGALALVVGSEGQGLRELTRKSCDYLARLPMTGRMESLNAAVAGSIALFLAFSARLKK